jgi:transcriptional regulator with XRE-family HTH domain
VIRSDYYSGMDARRVYRQVIGDRIRSRREAAGLSQQQLADRIGVPLPTLRHWEIGQREPRAAACLRLAQALGVAIEELVREPAPDEKPAPRKRGRPRKAAGAPGTPQDDATAHQGLTAAPAGKRRRRGKGK